ncbi:MAG: arsenate reductase ArsC [Candidatus Cloacimonetes bacterium]|nr:arsenate reductase ArsC [Candidatus Cloacimonadota bacterium]
MKKRILFVCVHNSARSQMAEAFCNQLGGDQFRAESAGLEPGKLNPQVVKVMQEVGIDISGNECNSVFDFFKQGRSYSYLITVCDQNAAERCPVFPGLVIDGRLHWSFKDPSSFTGDEKEILEKTREVRDEIKQQIMEFMENIL